MRVLGIAGSPRRGGNTDILLAEVLSGAADKGADTKTIVLSDLDISACRHCDDCQIAGLCSVQDDMQVIYDELEKADIIVLAFPVQFMGPPAQMKAMIDRCQALWARKYLLKKPPLGDVKPRKGFLVSVGGRRLPDVFEPSITVVKTLFKVIDVTYAGELTFKGVDEKGAIRQHPDALRQAFQVGQRLVEG